MLAEANQAVHGARSAPGRAIHFQQVRHAERGEAPLLFAWLPENTFLQLWFLLTARNSARHVGIKRSVECPIRQAAQVGGSQDGSGLNPKLKKLMKELGDAINQSLAESDQIGDVIARIKADGYDVFLVLEATVGFNRRDDAEPEKKPMLVNRDANGHPEFKLNNHDVKFLKSLRISLDDAA
jgi:hypothetical protein